MKRILVFCCVLLLVGCGSRLAVRVERGGTAVTVETEPMMIDYGAIKPTVDYSDMATMLSPGPCYFDFDRYNIRADQIDGLMAHAEGLQTGGAVTLEGHCDERGTVEYNLALGQRRADAVKAFLAYNGVERGRIQTVSYGKEHPAAQGHDEESWARNRRVEVIVWER